MDRNFILKQRPEVQFDPSNEVHRHAFIKFLREKTWADAPRFSLEEGYTCVPEMIKVKLLNYYVDQEFNVTPLKIVKSK